MNFSFIIITADEDPNRLNKVINSIPPTQECIVVHETYTSINGLIHNKDFTGKRAWITTKKNYGAKLAKYENLVFIHDYIELSLGFCEGYKDNDWNVSMCCIFNSDGSRYMDNLAWDDPNIGNKWEMREKWCPNGRIVEGQPSVVPYSYNNPKHMYVPGYFWIAKKQFMLENPLNEELCHCDAEDVEWSYRTRDKWKYFFNTETSVKLLKYKKPSLQFI